MTTSDGRVKFRRPAPETEAFAAFNKIYAVYGQFDNGVQSDYFKNKIRINDMLGTVKKIRENTVKSISFTFFELLIIQK